MARILRMAALIIFGVSAAAGTATAQNHPHNETLPFTITSDVPFDRLMAQAMDRMHAGMTTAKPTGDTDRDFLAMMIPHHQGAIDMAKVVLLHTQDPRIRNLAQSIITEQQYEINLMNGLLSEPVSKLRSTKENAQ
jgi:uncharacterized protein (DUF305 family)